MLPAAMHAGTHCTKSSPPGGDSQASSTQAEPPLGLQRASSGHRIKGFFEPGDIQKASGSLSILRPSGSS